MKLFMISLGGKVNGCNLEVHDVVFVAANHIDETVALLKSNWYGMPEKLHMDSHKVIGGADGYEVKLINRKPERESENKKTESNKKLYFVHMGGYLNNNTQELHTAGLLVGESEKEVKERAGKEIIAGEIQNHVDHLVNVESCLLSVDGEKYYIELTDSSMDFDRSPDWFGYRRLDIE